MPLHAARALVTRPPRLHTRSRGGILRDPASFVAFQAKMTKRAAHTTPVTVTIPVLPRRLRVIGQNVLVFPITPPFRHNKTARPQWGRAAVAVALGFEPRVAVTPHSISSAAPSAARTRYLTRILYYMDPHRAQIDREVWDQGHTTSQDHTAAHNTGTTSAFRTVENEIK